MVSVLKKALFSIALLGFLTPSANAQTWSPEQLEVWKVIQAQWEATKNEDPAANDFLHSSFLGWSTENPMPQNKASNRRWMAYQFANTKVLELELSPVGIVVEGNTAVAHYYYSEATENAKGERETIHGRYTDILIKDEGTWRFLAWQGGEN